MGAKGTIIKFASTLNPMIWRMLDLAWMCEGFRPNGSVVNDMTNWNFDWEVALQVQHWFDVWFIDDDHRKQFCKTMNPWI
jgi:hypothetical protein